MHAQTARGSSFSASGRAERVAYPVEVQAAHATPVYADDIEAASAVIVCGMLCQVGRGRGQNTPLLVLIDRFDCAYPATRSSVSNLDEYETVTVEHDDIQFTVTGQDIA